MIGTPLLESHLAPGVQEMRAVNMSQASPASFLSPLFFFCARTSAELWVHISPG